MARILNLPLDLIQHELLPSLDYYSRISLNLLLPPQERKGKPLLPIATSRLEYELSRCKLLQFIKSIRIGGNAYDTNRRLNKLKADMFLALQFNKSIRKKTMDIIVQTYVRTVTPSPGGVFVSRYMKKKVLNSLNTLLGTINTQFPEKETVVNFSKELRPVADIEDTLCVVDVAPDMNTRMEQQLAHGRAMMAFWTARGDFN